MSTREIDKDVSKGSKRDDELTTPWLRVEFTYDFVGLRWRWIT